MMDETPHMVFEDERDEAGGQFNVMQLNMVEGTPDQQYSAIVTPAHPGITVVGANLTQSRTSNHGGSFPQRQVHQCNICNKIFVSFKGLQQHAVIHTDQKPFSCEICGKSFRFKSNLFEHKSVHSGHISYSCTFCGKTCRLKGNLKKHLKTHVASKEELDEAWKPFARRCSNRKPPAEIPDDAVIVRGSGESFYPTPSRTGGGGGGGNRRKKLGLGDNAGLWVDKLKRGHIMPSVPVHDKLLRVRDMLRQRFYSFEEALDMLRAVPFESYECAFCKAAFACWQDADDHLQAEHAQHTTNAMYCQTCLVFFNDVKRFEQHQQHHKRVRDLLHSNLLSSSTPEIQEPEAFYHYAQSAAPLLDEPDVDIEGIKHDQLHL